MTRAGPPRRESGRCFAAVQLKTPRWRQGSEVRIDGLGWRRLKGGRNSNNQFCADHGQKYYLRTRNTSDLEVVETHSAATSPGNRGCQLKGTQQGMKWRKHSSYRGAKRAVAPFLKRSGIFRGGAAMLTRRRRRGARRITRGRTNGDNVMLVLDQNSAQIRFVSLKKVC